MVRRFVFSQCWRSAGLVISDYGKGVIDQELLKYMADSGSSAGPISVVDPKRPNYEAYRSATLITPIKEEAAEASGIAIRDEASLLDAGQKLLEKWRAKAVLITRGAEGV